MTASAAGTVEQPGINVAQKSGLNRAILSVGKGTVAVMLGYKVVWYGSELRRVPSMGTSQQCSGCGHTNQRGLARQPGRVPLHSLRPSRARRPERG